MNPVRPKRFLQRWRKCDVDFERASPSFVSLQAPAVHAPLPPAVRGPVAAHQQEVPHLQSGH